MRLRGGLEAKLAAGCLAATVALLAVGGFGAPNDHASDLDALGVALAALASLPLWGFRHAPLPAAGLVSGATVALVAFGYALDAPAGAVAAAYLLGTTAEEAGRRAAALVASAVMPGIAAALAVRGHDPLVLAPELLTWTLVVGAAWLAGDRSRLRRARVRDLEERLARTRDEVERNRRLAVAEERMRIARELHDSAGHAINVILVQAGAARLLRDRDPERSGAAIATIEDVARSTIGEIDQLVHALRDPGEHGRAAPATPAALPELVDRYRAAGLDVEAAVREPDSPVPPSVAWATYRILQEALTNAARHGAGAARIDVSFGRPAVTLRVVNPVASGGGARRTGGLGLIGMRERASLLGGTLEAARRGGQFHLEARLPYHGAPS